MNLFKIGILTLFFLISAGCKKTILQDNFQPTSQSGLIIKAGYTCGWGTGDDSIIISKSVISYRFYVFLKSPVPQIAKKRPVPESEWLEILNMVNMNDFLKLHYQSCDICFDGCDEWISIKNDDTTHAIRYSMGTRLDTISKLQDKLAQLRTEFQTKP